MIMPGNSRQIILDALQDFTETPHLAASKTINDLGDGGFRVVAYEELAGILQGMIDLVDSREPSRSMLTSGSYILAKAMLEVMKS